MITEVMLQKQVGIDTIMCLLEAFPNYEEKGDFNGKTRKARSNCC